MSKRPLVSTTRGLGDDGEENKGNRIGRCQCSAAISAKSVVISRMPMKKS
jgi:hypothetical protein